MWMGSCLPFPFHLPEGCPFEDLKKHAGYEIHDSIQFYIILYNGIMSGYD